MNLHISWNESLHHIDLQKNYLRAYTDMAMGCYGPKSILPRLGQCGK